MSGIAHLCDHRAVVYRDATYASGALRDEFGDTVADWQALPAPAGLNCRATLTESGKLTDYGPGEIQSTMQRWFLVAEFDVIEADVLKVESGPRAPLLLRVEKVEPGTHPLKINHFEVDVTVWKGDVTELELTS